MMRSYQVADRETPTLGVIRRMRVHTGQIAPPTPAVKSALIKKPVDSISDRKRLRQQWENVLRNLG
jgi:hypothetical protein